MRVIYKKVYQNTGGRIMWDAKLSARHDVVHVPGGRIEEAEFLLEGDDDARLEGVKDNYRVREVGQIPCFEDLDFDDPVDLVRAISQMRSYVAAKCPYKRQWFAGEIERFSDQLERITAARDAQAETERKAQEEADARADLKAIRETLEKNASLAKKEAGAGVKGILKTLDPKVVAIINNRQMTTKEKFIELRLIDKKFWGYTNAAMGDLLGVKGQRITQILAEIDKDAKKVKKEAENRIDEKFVDDRRRPQ